MERWRGGEVNTLKTKAASYKVSQNLNTRKTNGYCEFDSTDRDHDMRNMGRRRKDDCEMCSLPLSLFIINQVPNGKSRSSKSSKIQNLITILPYIGWYAFSIVKFILGRGGPLD